MFTGVAYTWGLARNMLLKSFLGGWYMICDMYGMYICWLILFSTWRKLFFLKLFLLKEGVFQTCTYVLYIYLVARSNSSWLPAGEMYIPYSMSVVDRCDSTSEVQCLKICQGHPNIVTLHQVFHDEVNKSNIQCYLQVQLYTTCLSVYNMHLNQAIAVSILIIVLLTPPPSSSSSLSSLLLSSPSSSSS